MASGLKFAQAERRQITVLFCDMVGSAALSTRLDPEENRDVVGAFLSCCATEIKRLDGMVATYLGDGILTYFGYPRAHEDDAERAVRAGLAILNSVKNLEPVPDVALQARIGIASGVVVVGDLVREGVIQENAALGETVNLAARLQTVAEPNAMVISPDTYELVGAMFEYRDLGMHVLKGFADPVHVRQVLARSNVENRFEARHLERISALLGRDEELEFLIRRWEQAKGGEGRVVLVTGEAGIGKSRITRALLERLAAIPHTRLTYHCSPHHRDSALYPIITQLLRGSSIEHGDDTDTKLNKLHTLLGQSGEPSVEDMALFAALLSISGDDRYVLPSITPKLLKERTLGAMLSQLQRLCDRQPVLMVFEDLHWIDPTSLELLSSIVERAPGMRLFLLATARPEFTAPWPNHRHVATQGLSRLGRVEGQALITAVTGGKAMPGEVLDQILARTDGVPLFIEELTKTVLESGLLRDAGNRYALTRPLPALAIPSTLHASLLARLDRMPSVKDVAQIGAAIGREFSYGLVAAASGIADAELKDVLTQLVEAELIFQRGVPPDATYTFKHALVQDAAYASLIRSHRQQVHASIARSLEEEFPDIVQSQPEILARHFSEADLTEKAIDYWEKAGLAAIARSAHLEAISHLQAALDAIENVSTLTTREARELSLVVALASSLRAARGNGSPEVGAAYKRALDLNEIVGDGPHTIPTLYGLWNYCQVICDYRASVALIGQ